MPIVLTRATKQAARYTPLGGSEHCSACRFFMPQGTCGRIIGPVSPEGWCKYYSREAVQRWSNPGYAGLGGLFSTASLNLDFMSPGALDPRITFTRASTATYFDSGGVLRTAATNAPRWDYDPVTHALRGLLIEEARTNVWLQSSDLSNPATGLGGVGVPGPAVTGNNATAPDGTNTATRVVYSAVSAAGQGCMLQQSLTGTVAPWSLSVWLRGSVGGEALYLSTTPDGVAYFRTSRITLTTSWQRFTLTTGNLTAATWFWLIGTDRRDASQTGTPAQTVYAWGAQVEQGAFPTSYIPTTAAAVTRAQDNAIMPTATWFNQPASTALIQYIAPVPTPGNDWETPVSIDDASANNRVQFYRVAGANNINANYTVAGTDTYTQGTGTLTPGAVTKSAIAWRTGYQISALNGVASSANTLSAIPAAATTLRLGQASGGALLDGCVQRFTYWPRALTATEMQQVTT